MSTAEFLNFPEHASLVTSTPLVKPPPTNLLRSFACCCSSRSPSTMATAVDQKLLRQTKFPPEFNQKVDMKKVNVEVLKK